MSSAPARASAPRLLEPFNLLILAAVALASFAPAAGAAALWLSRGSAWAIALLFFFQGAKLSREQLRDGLRSWRLHALVLLSTYLLFPLLGLVLRPLGQALLGEELYVGVLFLCAAPSTVQSAVVFTALACGNVAAAVCATALASLCGVLLTPLWMRALSDASVALAPPWDVALDLCVQLILPLLLGQLARRWIAAWIEPRRAALKLYDQLTIVAIVYLAFSRAVRDGLWQLLPGTQLFLLCIWVLGLLLLGLLGNRLLAKWLRLQTSDEIVLVFCGTKKGLATGAPIATLLFPGGGSGLVLLPLMLFHQLQLMVVAQLAQRYRRRALTPRSPTAPALPPDPPEAH